MKRKRGPNCTSKQATEKSACSINHKRRKHVDVGIVTHPVLGRYYPKLVSLRQYLLSKLPASSQKRRHKLSILGRKTCAGSELETANGSQDDIALAKLLDTTIVGVTNPVVTPAPKQVYREEFQHFTQAQSLSLGSAGTAHSSAQADYADVVDFAIWLIFNRVYSASRPPHVLCHGLQRATQTCLGAASSIPFLRSVHHNEHLEFFRGPQWKGAFKLLGKDSDAVILDVILHCGVFIAVDGALGAFYQLSGVPLSELAVVEEEKAAQSNQCKTPVQLAKRGERPEGPLGISAIRFVRHRLLYAKPALNARGGISLGLRHIHVFNRYADADNREHTIHILKYIFPRQFGLHNVFTSKVDQRDTTQSSKDYTLREKEIAWAKQSKNIGRGGAHEKAATDPVPKRLRGKALELVKRLQRLHGRCSYMQVLAHYCPFPEDLELAIERGTEMPHFTKLATPTAHLSAFCQAIVHKIIPRGFLGEGEGGDENWKKLLKSIDVFLQARRFESFCLDSVMKDVKINKIEWLCPINCNPEQRMALSDFQKRQEILAELIYYIFDSFLIPLVRSNFYVTESGVHKNRLFYFRHDVWRYMTEPHLKHLMISMYEELGNISALERMGSTSAKASQLRLLPKDRGMRAITNLRRRPQTLQNGKLVLGRSINSILKPAFTVLNFERERRPGKFTGSLFSIGGIYDKVRSFREGLTGAALTQSKLYFVKVDVKSCFDSLPQDMLLRLVKGLLASRHYVIARHAEVKPPEGLDEACDGAAMKPARRFVAKATVPRDFEGLTHALADEADGCPRGAVFVDGVVPQGVERAHVYGLVEEHIKHNLIKVGKRFYRQKRGIAQGSVLSSLLCNLLYADFETQQLQHTSHGRSIMLRLIDDFLLITTERAHAEWFLEKMHCGSTEYGITVKAEKSLTNFEADSRRSQVPRLGDKEQKFPFCGLLIDTQTLDLSKDGTRFSGKLVIADGLTS